MSIYTDVLDAVRCGKRYRISLKEKTIKINGNELLLTDDLIDEYDTVKINKLIPLFSLVKAWTEFNGCNAFELRKLY